jgi:hypothetical protein
MDGDWLAEFQDVDVDAIRREVEAELGTAAEPERPRKDDPASAADMSSEADNIKPRSDDAVESPFPIGYGEDVLPEELGESPFPERYGEDLLEDE